MYSFSFGLYAYKLPGLSEGRKGGGAENARQKFGGFSSIKLRQRAVPLKTFCCCCCPSHLPWSLPFCIGATVSDRESGHL